MHILLHAAKTLRRYQKVKKKTHKHVFIVHSNISILVASQIIERKNINVSQCLILRNSIRSHAPFHSEIDIIDYGAQEDNFLARIVNARKFIFLLPINTLYILVQLVILRYFRCGFELYTPNSAIPVSKLLASSLLCKNVLCIEEGVGSLVQERRSDSIKTHNLFDFSSQIIPNHQKKYFGLERLDEQFEKTMSNSFRFAPQFSPFMEGGTLWVFDTLVDRYYIERHGLFDIVRSHLCLIPNLGNVFFQFHPQQDHDSQEYIRHQLGFDAFCQINLPLEIMEYPKNFKVFGFSSSLLYYLKLRGCQTVSLVPRKLHSHFNYELFQEAGVKFIS